MRPFLIVQHHEVEAPGVFAEILAERALAAKIVRPDRGEAVPDNPDPYEGLIVMGGPMGVYEEERYPWLRNEDRLITAAIARDMPTLGICLGSQLIAKAGGARVAPGPEKEIGWYTVTLTPDGRRDTLFAGLPRTFESFEWHGDIFDLPKGAVNLVGSARYPYQAFRLGRRVYGLLFHLEVTAQMIRAMTEAFQEEVISLGDRSRLNAILANLDRRTPSLNAHGRRLFEAFLDQTATRGVPNR